MLYLPKADPPGLKNFEHENACFVHLVTPLTDNSELPGKFYHEKIPLASIIVSRTWLLRFTSKRIPGMGSDYTKTILHCTPC